MSGGNKTVSLFGLTSELWRIKSLMQVFDGLLHEVLDKAARYDKDTDNWCGGVRQVFDQLFSNVKSLEEKYESISIARHEVKKEESDVAKVAAGTNGGDGHE